MKNINESSGIKSSGGNKPILSFRGSRFRFPFRQKSNLQASSTSPVSSPTGFSKFLGNKILGSQSRKSVSFSPSTSSFPMSNYTDTAYSQAVSKLRSILSPKSSIPTSPIRSARVGDLYTTPSIKRDWLSTSPGYRSSYVNNNLNVDKYSIPSSTIYRPRSPVQSVQNDDLMQFIDKQNEYITQLEKETKYSREELSQMLNNVRDVINENEVLNEKKKTDILSSMINQIDEKTGSGSGGYYKNSSIGKLKSGDSKVIIESKIAELEAQLSQTKRSLRLAQEEILDQRNGKFNVDHQHENFIPSDKPYAHCDIHRSEIDRLSKEKNDLIDTLTKFKNMMNELKDRESEAAKKVKHSLEIVEQMQIEKSQSDAETRRLKEELDRHQQRIRDMIQDHSKRLHEEKSNVEKKYRLELDHLNNSMNEEMDSLTKTRIDLERQKRIESDVRRELIQKASTIDDLKQEMQIKLNHLQNELSRSLTSKSNAEQELINVRLNHEKSERDAKLEVTRLQAEINGLRRRYDQSDLEIGRNDEVIARLNETIAQLHREISMNKLRSSDGIATREGSESDLINVLQGMETKHSHDMSEMESLIQAQNSLLDKLRDECKILSNKLEETSSQYKDELLDQFRVVVSSTLRSQSNNTTDTDNTSSKEIEDKVKQLTNELGLVLQEMIDWLKSNESKPEEAKDDDEKEISESEDNKVGDVEGESEVHDEETANKDEENGDKEEKTEENVEPKDDVIDLGLPLASPVEERRFDDHEEEHEERESNEGDRDEADDGEEKEKDVKETEELKEKIIEINSMLIDWSSKIEDIYQRFSSCLANNLDS